MTTSGIVHIHWKPGLETDMLGYLVYSANDAKHTFIPVSTDVVADTAFTDSITLATLTKHIYYKVVALDKNRNPSAFSDALELRRPDRVPPVAPVFNNFRLTDSTVVLNWVKSSSSDLASQILYRREKGKDWIPLATLSVFYDSYIDYQPKKQAWYEYSLEAVDSSGLHSQKSFPVNVRIYDSGKRRDISEVNVIKSSDEKSLFLSWKYSEKGDFWFLIYRSVDGREMMSYKTVKSDQSSFTDTSLKKGMYQYAIKVVYQDGGESQAVKSGRISVDPSVK